MGSFITFSLSLTHTDHERSSEV